MHCSPNVPGQFGRHAASQEDHLHLVMNLVERHGCDPNSLDDDNVTPLHMAALQGHLSIVKYFTQNKECSPTIKNKFNQTPLQLSLEKGHSEVVEYLFTKQ